MSQSEDIKHLVNARLQQAQNALESGELLLNQQFYADAIS